MQRPATSKMKIELPSLIIAAAGIVAVIAADVGGHVADIDVADAHGDMRRLAVIAPAVQHMLDLRIGKQRVMRASGPGSW